MKVTTVLASFLAAASLNAAVIEQVIVRQQWPWSTDVKVEYKLSGVTSPVDISVKAFNGNVELDSSRLAASMTGDRYGITEDGVGTIIIDPVKAFGTSKVALANFKVKLSVSDSAANLNEVLYKVFNLETGECEDITRVQLLNGKYGPVETDFSKIGAGFNTALNDVIIWTGVTNNVAYKTTHLVMRKIPAAGIEWTIGSRSGEVGAASGGNAEDERQHTVRLTEDFYMSVFEITQSQYAKFYDLRSGGFINEEDSSMRPVETCKYGSDLKGLSDWKAEDGSASHNECICWPTNAYRHCTRGNRMIGKMRSKLGVKVDLPTSAQWEFACRAGTQTGLYSGKELTNANGTCPNVEEIAWTASSDYSDAPGGKAQTRVVGLKKPNAFGLYDMAGNVSEWCLDWFYSDIDTFYDDNGNGVKADILHSDPLVDPVGRSVRRDTNNLRVRRGGGWYFAQKFSRSAYRGGHNYEAEKNYLGIRLVAPVAADWK